MTCGKSIGLYPTRWQNLNDSRVLIDNLSLTHATLQIIRKY